MKIRAAVPADLKQCITLDHHYSTTRVWQMDRREEPSAGAVMVSFHSVRLPRPMRVQYPRDPNHLWDDWRSWDRFLVADHDGYIHGYLGILTRTFEYGAWIRDIVVGSPFRKNGVGTALLRGAMEWAAECGFSHLTLEMQSKNYPAIRFCQKHGFQFRGFNEAYYPNQDIALYFVTKLH